MASLPRDDFPAFVQDPPVIEISGGVVFLRYGGTVERAMSIRTLARSVDRAQRALKRHASSEDHIVVDD